MAENIFTLLIGTSGEETMKYPFYILYFFLIFLAWLMVMKYIKPIKFLSPSQPALIPCRLMTRLSFI